MGLTRSQIEGMDPSAFGALASQVGAAHSVLTEHAEAQERVSKGLSDSWRGSSADQAQSNVDDHTARIRSNVEGLKQLQKAFSNGEQNVGTARQQFMGAVAQAESAGYRVGEDLSVKDGSGQRGLRREAGVREHQEAVNSAVNKIQSAQQQTNSDIDQAKQQLQKTDAKLMGVPGGLRPKLCPHVVGSSPMGGRETQWDSWWDHDDLGATWSDSGDYIGGDGEHNRQGGIQYPDDPSKSRPEYPDIDGKPNPIPVPDGSRPLPTGTALGPNGEKYALFGIVPYSPPGFTTPDTAVYRMTRNADGSFTPQFLGVLKGISQASAVYDPDSHRMYVVGNVGPGKGALRAMWISDIVNPAKPDEWVKSFNEQKQPDALYPHSPGDRENQVVALKGGGYLQVDAANERGVRAFAACTPEELTAQEPFTVVTSLPDPEDGPKSGSGAYGPTVVSQTYDSWSKSATAVVRVSTWDGKGPPEKREYHPHTQLYRVDIQYS